ncbi:Patatin/Phospholipase A2-related protein [Corchorus olitorius]|uniref:Patatin n=1 Tax=Corchorus olitorius TaxID=93759 RepID=A0A1R3JN29_9ROSI|nr:Patatin/Phospholipase A2-related protein [Corchorus olitorius]
MKKLDGEEARIADYFDFIAGTSTGGLVTTLFSSPDPQEPKNRPFSGENIIKFYHEEGPKIFPQKSTKIQPYGADQPSRVDIAAKELVKAIMEEEYYEDGRSASLRSFSHLMNWFKPIMELWKSLWKPKHENKKLKEVIEAKIGKRKLRQTPTNVLITSFDVKLLQPKVFSSLKASRDDLEDASLVDVCLSTSAAPLYLPLHIFETTSANRTENFHMTDGGVAANNPTLLAILEASKERNLDIIGKAGNKSKDCSNLLVLSLGTGSTKRNGTNMDFMNSNWGPFHWLLQGLGDGSIPIVNVLMDAKDAMVDIYLSALFQSTSSKSNYLRIQTDSLTNAEAGMDDSSKGHLETLEKIGNELLTKPVSAVKLETGLLEPIDEAITNAAALTDFARRLVAERSRRRQAQCST